MGKPGQATQAKRNRERSRQDRQQEKEEKKAIRKEQKKERALILSEGVDPDLIGIEPGPQPIEDPSS